MNTMVLKVILTVVSVYLFTLSVRGESGEIDENLILESMEESRKKNQ